MNSEIKDEIAVNGSSLMHLEDWDLADNNIFIAKIQHKLQQTVCIVDQKFETCCVRMKSLCRWHNNLS